MKNPKKNDVEEIKSRLNCLDVLSRHGIEYPAGGGDISCPIPGHDDGKPSFGVFEGGTRFRCHGCNKGGDSIQLERELSGVGFVDALKTLAGWAGVNPAACQDTPRGPGKLVQAYRYTDEGGELLFEVLRYEPKAFRQRRPDPDNPGGWVWNLKGVRRVLYRMPAVLDAVQAGETVFICEGEKDVVTVGKVFGLAATTPPGGAGKWLSEYTESLRGADVVILPDSDKPGQEHAADVAAKLHGTARRVRVLELPAEREGVKAKDVSDWQEAGGTVEEFLALAAACPDYVPRDKPAAGKSRSRSRKSGGKDSLPVLNSPDGGEHPLPMVAEKAGKILAGTDRFFSRAGVAVEAMDGEGLRNVVPALLVSELQPPACRVVRWTEDGKKPCVLSESRCKAILHARAFVGALPEIKHLARCPAFVPDDSGGLRLVEGFDGASGVLVRGWDGGKIPDIPTAEAVRLLLDVVRDFDFPTESDKARALSLILTPAFMAGQLLGENVRAPVGLIEADQSQTGKGYIARLIADIYKERPVPLTQRKGGVGSLDESFSSAIFGGAGVVIFDNLKGGLDSPMLESATTEPEFPARVPYHGALIVDVRRLFVLLTSNKAELTKDLANRCCAVRLRKRSPDFKFTRYPVPDEPHGVDIQTHIQRNRARYVGAVVSIVRAWWDAGRPQTEEGRHSFRGWVRPLDWIMQNLFDLPPLLAGHTEAQARVADPTLQWLRDVSLAVHRAGMMGRNLAAHDIYDICQEHEIDVPGVGDSGGEDDRRQGMKQIGRRFSRWFRDGQTAVDVDGFRVTRREEVGVRGGDGVLKTYVFTRSGGGGGQAGKSVPDSPSVPDVPELSENTYKNPEPNKTPPQDTNKTPSKQGLPRNIRSSGTSRTSGTIRESGTTENPGLSLSVPDVPELPETFSSDTGDSEPREITPDEADEIAELFG